VRSPVAEVIRIVTALLLDEDSPVLELTDAQKVVEFFGINPTATPWGKL